MLLSKLESNWNFHACLSVCLFHCLIVSLYAHCNTVRDICPVCRTFFCIHCYYLNQICVSLCIQGVLRVRKRVTLMGVTVTVIFGICWAPDIIAHNVDVFTSVTISELAYAAIHMVVLFNSAVNPFVYALVNKNFREKLKGMICCSLTGSTRNRVGQHTSNL